MRLLVVGVVLALVAGAVVACGGSGEVAAPVVPFVDVAVGERHACALRSDGRVACWGSNGLSQAPAGVCGGRRGKADRPAV